MRAEIEGRMRLCMVRRDIGNSLVYSLSIRDISNLNISPPRVLSVDNADFIFVRPGK